MHQDEHITKEILSFDLRTPEQRDEALMKLATLMALADAGVLGGLAIRRQKADGTVEYETYGEVSSEDLTQLLLGCARAPEGFLPEAE